jgi:NAD(P)-dependent dehydrogenase (short-subunit alcohol dehydrogenase family)
VAAYSAAKTGLGTLARSVAENYSTDNVRCNVICPGYVETEYMTDADKDRFRTHRGFTGFQRPRSIGEFAADLICGSAQAANGAIIDVVSDNDAI